MVAAPISAQHVLTVFIVFIIILRFCYLVSEDDFGSTSKPQLLIQTFGWVFFLFVCLICWRQSPIRTASFLQIDFLYLSNNGTSLSTFGTQPILMRKEAIIQ